ncbi:hypothetical protein NK6_5524 [Bradyrhizobium diazoefficiens]|uniref:Uncharacterized protein n=1 Tax=Bradyrhizobium diazoefficiens TaxID=1355477 RepID=A0A0E4BS91_9BRAD|nr:hypothetical protein NK6_5524 [Bradyrhizobium diazoefficiens]
MTRTRIALRSIRATHFCWDSYSAASRIGATVALNSCTVAMFLDR